jgi:transcriptional regulator with XRE-family HTH domain
MAPFEHGLTVRHRRLGTELRKLRERAGMTPEAAARSLGWSRPKLVKFETAARRPTLAEVSEMLDLYGGDDAIKLALMQLTRDVHKRGWWSAYDDVLSGSFAELEDLASEIHSFQAQLVPGLLQTEDYALALIRAGRQTREDLVDQRLRARMTRKTLLLRQHPPTLTIVLDEAVLRRPVGGTEVMHRQFESLLETRRRSNVSVQVLPASVGLHPAIGEGSFVIFGFPEPGTPDVVYLETVAGGLYVEDIQQVARCSVKFRHIAEMALTVEESAAFVAGLIKE